MYFLFLRRRKRHPLDATQFMLNDLKTVVRDFRTIGAEEDGSLAKSHNFNMLLVNEHSQLEATGKIDSIM